LKAPETSIERRKMMLKRKPLIFYAAVIAIVALFAVTPAAASCTGFSPCDVSNLTHFLTNGCGDFFNSIDPPNITLANVCESQNKGDFPFDERLRITAIGLHAGHQLVVGPDLGGLPSVDLSLFDTDAAACFWNWGLWYEYDFSRGLGFEDKQLEYHEFDLFSEDYVGNDFQVCKLWLDSNPIPLPPPHTGSITLPRGTWIIGYDNEYGDLDWNDIIIAAGSIIKAVAPTQVASKTDFTQTDEVTGKTCSISIEEEKLALCKEGDLCPAAITVTEGCSGVMKLLTSLTFGVVGDERDVKGFFFRKWVGTHGSPGQFTYCYPSGYCVVFTF